MKDYEAMIAKLREEQRAQEEQKENDILAVSKALKEISYVSHKARKELEPAIKRLQMFVNGERYTRAKKD